jgi:SAM-dependent methyltransferase
VSLAYERGWRQGFAWAGFPGVEEEFRYAMEYLEPQFGQLLVDVSCGSGLFLRRFAKSGKFSSVIGSDFSESMLNQAYNYVQDDTAVDQSKLLLLRADVGRLPFKTGSVAALHAGGSLPFWMFTKSCSLLPATLCRILSCWLAQSSCKHNEIGIVLNMCHGSLNWAATC